MTISLKHEDLMRQETEKFIRQMQYLGCESVRVIAKTKPFCRRKQNGLGACNV